MESDEGVAGFGKVKSAPFDRWTDGMGDSGVAKDLLEMVAVHNNLLPPDGTGRESAVVGSSWRRPHSKPGFGFS